MKPHVIVILTCLPIIVFILGYIVGADLERTNHLQAIELWETLEETCPNKNLQGLEVSELPSGDMQYDIYCE